MQLDIYIYMQLDIALWHTKLCFHVQIEHSTWSVPLSLARMRSSLFTSLSTLTWYDDTTCVGSSEVAIAADLNSGISTALMRPRRPKQYCLQLYIYIDIF